MVWKKALQGISRDEERGVFTIVRWMCVKTAKSAQSRGRLMDKRSKERRRTRQGVMEMIGERYVSP